MESPTIPGRFRYFADTSFKNSLVRVHLHVLIAVIAQAYPDADKVISEVLADEAEKVEHADAGLAASKGLGARVEFFLEKHKNKADLVGRLVGALKTLVIPA